MSESTETSQSSISSENAKRPTRRAKEAARQKVSKITAQRNDDDESPAKEQPKGRGKPKELPSRPRARTIQPLETLDEQPTGAQKTKLKDLLIDAQHSVHSHEKLAERFKTLLQEARLQVVDIYFYYFEKNRLHYILTDGSSQVLA